MMDNISHFRAGDGLGPVDLKCCNWIVFAYFVTFHASL